METENPEELKLYNVTEKDEGWYTCIAQNTLGETFSSAYLRVVESESADRALYANPSSFVDLHFRTSHEQISFVNVIAR